jgi:hypothetical protein
VQGSVTIYVMLPSIIYTRLSRWPLVAMRRHAYFRKAVTSNLFDCSVAPCEIVPLAHSSHVLYCNAAHFS